MVELMVVSLNKQLINGSIRFLSEPSLAVLCMKFVKYKPLGTQLIHMLNVHHKDKILMIKI